MAIDTIGTNAIANDAVTAAKIPAGAVDADITAIPDGSVTTAKLDDNAVTGAKLNDSVSLGRRNILINGAFQHWQRGTSFTANGYGSDRWKLYAPGSHSYSRSTDTPASPNNFEYSASVGGSGDATGLTQFVESSNAKHVPSSGTTKIILSFYLKHTTNSGTGKITSVVGTMDSADNSGASTNRSTKNHDTTTSWARYTHEMTGADLTSAVTNGLVVTIKHNGSGTTAFLLTGCQLEINESLTPFETRNVGEELSLCQRYYFETDKITGQVANSTNAIFQGLFPTEMRATPSVSGGPYTIWQMTVAGSKTQSSANNNADSNQNNNQSFNIQCGNFSGLSQYYPVGIASGGPIKFSSEI